MESESAFFWLTSQNNIILQRGGKNRKYANFENLYIFKKNNLEGWNCIIFNSNIIYFIVFQNIFDFCISQKKYILQLFYGLVTNHLVSEFFHQSKVYVYMAYLKI